MPATETLWQQISATFHELTGAGRLKPGPSISGGSINHACRVQNEEGRHFFIKFNSGERLPMFEAERDGLNELITAAAMRVPQPICCGQSEGKAWLISEFIEFGHAGPGSERKLGEQLARLHQQQAGQFGWYRDNTIGATPQLNRQCADWPEFYGVLRLKYQFDLAARHGFGGGLQRKGEQLLAGLSAFFSDYMPVPSLLHGDLWGGNHAYDRAGEPVIFDPAVYYGDREADIAMTELFGGFGREFYAGYNQVWPLDPGYKVRKTLYNLYHILNHANLFGGGYVSQAESMCARLLSELAD